MKNGSIISLTSGEGTVKRVEENEDGDDEMKKKKRSKQAVREQ